MDGQHLPLEKIDVISARLYGEHGYPHDAWTRLRRESPVEAIAATEWREVMATILDGAFYCAQACVPHLRASGAGSIVNIGGMTGHTGAKNRAHVVAAKAGLAGLTKALAQELAGDRITVNCVSPGLIDTVRGASSVLNPEHHRSSRNVLGRRGSPQEIAAAVVYLCGPGARYVTGQTLHVNGGGWMGLTVAVVFRITI